jgi:hypothetical protein
MTSVRWLTTADAQGGYSGLVGSVFKACRASPNPNLRPDLNPDPKPDPDPKPTPNVFKACRALGVLQPGEIFDSEVGGTLPLGHTRSHGFALPYGQTWQTKC